MVAGVDDRVPLVFCTVEQAAYALGIKARFAWALVAKGDRGDPDGLRAVRIGLRLRRVPVWEIQRYAHFLAGEAADALPDALATGADRPAASQWFFLSQKSPVPFGRGG
jgi:hypothetical protein